MNPITAVATFFIGAVLTGYAMRSKQKSNDDDHLVENGEMPGFPSFQELADARKALEKISNFEMNFSENSCFRRGSNIRILMRNATDESTKNLIALRFLLKMTQIEFANLLNMDVSFISNWENGATLNNYQLKQINKISGFPLYFFSKRHASKFCQLSKIHLQRYRSLLANPL